ncbi:MAG: malonyl-ACP O-methyltransferase BioC [Gammaproteobacteria bacterium]|nr:malonyl-ACP O-methyltransferase BioC [Gammaproteobacteria bacterium]
MNPDYYNKIKQAFNKAAASYSTTAVLQQEICHRLTEQLEFFTIKPELILDLGIGTGLSIPPLANLYPDSKIIGLDFAEQMLNIAKLNNQNNNNLFICADINNIPIADNSVDIIFSNFSLQWCDNIADVFRECYRILKNDGLFIFSIPGPSSLYELKEALNAVDPEYDHVNNFIDMHDLGDMLVQNKFAHPVMDNDQFTLTYKNIINILKDLKALGANTKLSANYRKTLFGKYKFNQLYYAYEKFKQSDNKYPLTYEVIYAHAFKLAKPVRVKHPELSEIAVPIEKIIKK